MTTRKMPGDDEAEPAAASEEPAAASEEPAVLPIEDWIDLHAFAPRDVPAVVEEYLRECYRLGIPEVRIIHGRGIGVQREIVRSILARTPFVRAFADAPAEAGGWGATRAILQANPPAGMDKPPQ